ncbi:MAG: hypothetical protein WA102_05635 [Candidatus Methanoperedens sp.]|jgi:hypothetical protein
MSELSNVVFYFLNTVAQVYATIAGFFIVGQIYIYGVIQKTKEWNEVHQKSTDGKSVCVKIVVTKPIKNIFVLLLSTIFLSILGIFLNIESIFGKGILVIPTIVLFLAVLVIIRLYDYIITLEKYT